MKLIYSQLLINICVESCIVLQKLHCFICDHGVEFVSLLFDEVFDVGLLILEPAQVVSDQVQVITAFAAHEYDSFVVCPFCESSRLPVLSHIAGVHDHVDAGVAKFVPFDFGQVDSYLLRPVFTLLYRKPLTRFRAKSLWLVSCSDRWSELVKVIPLHGHETANCWAERLQRFWISNALGLQNTLL